MIILLKLNSHFAKLERTNMLSQFLRDPILLIYFIPTLVISLSVHELSHGLAAYAMGDPTAKNNGRLSLNPLAHLDAAGTFMLLVFGFGWAKPVPVNPMYFKNRKAGMVVTSIAGPISNLIMGFLSLALFLLTAFNDFGIIGEYLNTFAYLMTSINVGLAVFNLLPISPLDGSKILYAVLPNNTYFKIMKYERYFAPILMILLFLGWLTIPLNILRGIVINFFALILAPLFGVPASIVSSVF